MRHFVITHTPSVLSSRIHRVLEEDTKDEHSTVDLANWNWEDAEKRLTDAYKDGGIVAWGEVALKELQAEERIERMRREDMKQRKDG